MFSMKNIESLIKDLTKGSNRTWGIYAEDIDTGKKFELNKDKVYETASTVKVFVLLALFNKLTKEKISEHTPIKVKRKNIGTIGRSSGVIQYFDWSQPLTLYNIALLMIIVSDNAGTNVLIDYLGKDYINNYISKNLNLKKTKLLTSKVDFPSKFRLKSTKMGSTTPFEISKTLKSLEENKLFDKKTSRKLIKILTQQEYSTLIPRYLPTWANVGYKENKIKQIGNKTGSIVYEDDDYYSVRSDTALIFAKGKKRFVFSIYHEGPEDRSHIFTPDNVPNIVASRISESLFNYLST